MATQDILKTLDFSSLKSGFSTIKADGFFYVVVVNNKYTF